MTKNIIFWRAGLTKVSLSTTHMPRPSSRTRVGRAPGVRGLLPPRSGLGGGAGGSTATRTYQPNTFCVHLSKGLPGMPPSSHVASFATFIWRPTHPRAPVLLRGVVSSDEEDGAAGPQKVGDALTPRDRRRILQPATACPSSALPPHPRDANAMVTAAARRRRVCGGCAGSGTTTVLFFWLARFYDIKC